MFEARVKVEWEALKNKDKKAYAELLADDYQGVEVDGRGERNKIQAVNELADENVYNYTLWGLKLIPLGPDATLVIYEYEASGRVPLKLRSPESPLESA